RCVSWRTSNAVPVAVTVRPLAETTKGRLRSFAARKKAWPGTRSMLRLPPGSFARSSVSVLRGTMGASGSRAGVGLATAVREFLGFRRGEQIGFADQARAPRAPPCERCDAHGGGDGGEQTRARGRVVRAHRPFAHFHHFRIFDDFAVSAPSAVHAVEGGLVRR